VGPPLQAGNTDGLQVFINVFNNKKSFIESNVLKSCAQRKTLKKWQNIPFYHLRNKMLFSLNFIIFFLREILFPHNFLERFGVTIKFKIFQS